MLLLGVGGGSAIHLLRRFVEPAEIIGVELSKTHLQVARQFFGIKKNMATLYHADAVKWLEEYDGPPFDLIIDDLFGNEDDVERAVPADTPWCNTLLKNLNKNGMLVMNFIGSKAVKQSACMADPSIMQYFKSMFQLSLPAYENVIGIFSGAPTSGKALHKNLSNIPELSQKALNFKLRTLIKQPPHNF